MQKLLIFYDYFSPAFKAGGPIRSLNNLVHLIHQEVEIYIYTAAIDLDNLPLQVEKDKWVPFLKNVLVFYGSKKNLSIFAILKNLRRLEPDAVYINGIFTPYAVLFPLISLKLYQRSKTKPIKIVLAPRGMLQKGALALKAGKKDIYLKMFRLFGLHKGLYWHATDQQELEDIKFFEGKGKYVEVIGNVPVFPIMVQGKQKATETFRLVTVSLVARKKNHHFILKCLKILPKEISIMYDIYGPVKDAEYWKLLEREIQNLPSNIRVTYKGAIQPDQVSDKLNQYDCFVLPTLGENFGHAIFEAMGAGLPVLISDQTPWRSLEKEKAGWDLPLEEKLWIDKLTEIAAIEDAEWQQWQEGAYFYAMEHLKKQNLKEQYMALFGI